MLYVMFVSRNRLISFFLVFICIRFWVCLSEFVVVGV